MGPYIKDGHYMFGNTFCENGRPPYYNCIPHHQQPGLRDFPNKQPFTDGTPFHPDSNNPNCTGNCGCGNGTGNVVRSPLMYNLVNIETKLITSLQITLYGVTKDLDKEIIMEIGKRYAITYITESGFKTADGILKEISKAIPDNCMRYIGEYNATAVQAYIGMDCSDKGISDKRMIYICSIRDIQPLEFDEEFVEPDTSNPEDAQTIEDLDLKIDILSDKMDGKMDEILEAVEHGSCFIGEIIEGE